MTDIPRSPVFPKLMEGSAISPCGELQSAVALDTEQPDFPKLPTEVVQVEAQSEEGEEEPIATSGSGQPGFARCT